MVADVVAIFRRAMTIVVILADDETVRVVILRVVRVLVVEEGIVVQVAIRRRRLLGAAINHAAIFARVAVAVVDDRDRCVNWVTPCDGEQFAGQARCDDIVGIVDAGGERDGLGRRVE
jgi:hypothetical protein